MAYKDRSQGFGFVYVNLGKILQGRDNGSGLETLEEAQKPESTTPKINFNRTHVEPSEKESPTKQSVAEIKANLDRLTGLHRKLHLILEELSSVTGKKK